MGQKGRRGVSSNVVVKKKSRAVMRVYQKGVSKECTSVYLAEKCEELVRLDILRFPLIYQ